MRQSWSHSKFIGDKARVVATDYLDQIGIGFDGHEELHGFGDRYGASASAAGDDVWMGAASVIPIPDQTVGEQMTVVSTSLNDTLTGTGMQKVDIHGLDATGAEVSEVLDMAGTTPVNTVRTNWRFIQSIHAEQVGSGGFAAGDITIYRTGDATRVYNLIDSGGNMSLSSARMVPVGKTLIITGWSCGGTSDKDVVMRLRATSTFEYTLTPGLFFLFKRTMALKNNSRYMPLRPPERIPSLAIVKVTAWSTQAGGTVSGGWDGFVE